MQIRGDHVQTTPAAHAAAVPADPRPVPPDLFLVTDHPAQGIVRHPRHAAITA